MIFLFFFVAFNNDEQKRYIVFKLLFIWFGFTMIIPFLYIQKLIAAPHLIKIANAYGFVLQAYLPIYGLMIYVLYVAFFKDVVLFFKESVKGFKGGELEGDLMSFDGKGD